MIIEQICSKLVWKFVQWMLRLHTAVLAQLLTSCELTARSIEGVYVYSTLGHMSKHAAFTRPPWVECFSVMQCMVHSTTLDPGTGAISREWLLGLLCPKPVTGRNELCFRAMPQGPSWPTRGHLLCLPWLFLYWLCFDHLFLETEFHRITAWPPLTVDIYGQWAVWGGTVPQSSRDHWVF